MVDTGFWDIVFYVALVVFLGWAILKTLGMIGTPEWLAIGVPALSGGIAIGSFYQKFKQLEKNLDDVCKKTNQIYKKCPEVGKD